MGLRGTGGHCRDRCWAGFVATQGVVALTNASCGGDTGLPGLGGYQENETSTFFFSVICSLLINYLHLCSGPYFAFEDLWASLEGTL